MSLETAANQHHSVIMSNDIAVPRKGQTVTFINHGARLLILLWCLAPLAEPSANVWLINISGAIGPASADHMIRGVEQAQAAKARMVILRIDTPGGLDSAMRQMIKAILAARIPIVAYVSPAGARAASAGTYILYASHIAAMTPATNLGAATPVQIGTPSLPTLPSDKSNSKDQQEEPAMQPGTAMEKKVINDAVAYIQGLAELRGRNAKWAADAVQKGVSLPAEQALENGVIDIVATDVGDLLKQLDGRSLTINNTNHLIDTSETELYTFPTDWRSEFLAVITDPNIAYMLMLIGIYGLIFEFSNPGLGLPGILGAVCLLLAMYAFQVLPISYVGLGLILLGISLMTAEAFAPSFGILGLGGITAFVIGSVILMDTELPGYQIALPMIIAFATFSVGLLVLALGLIVKARKQAVVTGLHHLVGCSAVVENIHNNAPLIRLEGELWQVQCSQQLNLNDTVSVTDASSVILQVEKLKGEEQ